MNPRDVRFAVRLTPRGIADRVDGVVDGVLQARVSAPPVEGAANQALVRLIAAELGVARGAVHLIAGASGRVKLVTVDGVDARGDRGALARPAPLIRRDRRSVRDIMRLPERGPGD